MKKLLDNIIIFEFEYRIFVSLGIILFTCTIIRLFSQNTPSLIVLIGSTIKLSVTASLSWGYASVGIIVGSASLIRMWAGSVLRSHRIMSFRVRTDSLLSHGPYQLVRNPIYFADLIAICGFTLCLPPAGLLMPLLFIVHYLRLIKYEEASLHKRFGQEYLDYFDRIPKLIPSFRSIRNYIDSGIKIRLNRDGIRYNSLYLLFVPGFILASFTHELWQAIVLGLPAVLDWSFNHTKIGFTKQRKSKVFNDILYASCWEDPAMDRTAFAIKPDDVVFSITSGGCNVLTFLLDNPREVIALDINVYQNHLLQLKMAAIQKLQYEELLEFIGVRDSGKRETLYLRIRQNLSKLAQEYWDDQLKKIKKGIIHCGRFEKYIRIVRILVKSVAGKRLIDQFFETESQSARESLYKNKWNNIRWKILTRIILSRTVMSLFFDKAFFAQLKDNFSFGKHFAHKGMHALTELPMKDSYFLSYILLGKYFDEDHLPPYLRRNNCEIIRKRLNRIKIITDSCENYFSHLSDGYISKFNFTNIFEWMPKEIAEALMKETYRVAKNGAIMTFRNLLVPRGCPGSLSEAILLNELLATQLHNHDLSFIYNKYIIAKIQKEKSKCYTESRQCVPEVA
jgi:S-adenosylmethionine-diacylglycerol 3-amino-3-carboxypropyl transferase